VLPTAEAHRMQNGHGMGHHVSMAHDRKFRFAAQLSRGPDATAHSWADQARRAEDLGYASLLMPDHFGDQLAPVPALAAVASATTTLRMGSLVFGNDYRHPVVLAKEAATLDVLSEGRFELSLGAGWMKTDYEEAGLTYDVPRLRVERFEEAVQVLQGLLRTDGPFSFEGTHYQIRQHTLLPRPVQHPGPPLIIGGGGKRVLSFAARHADIVSINVNLRQGTGGPETAPNASPERTREKVAWVKEAAGERFDELELNALVGFVMITDDSASIAEAMAPHFGISSGDALHIPLALLGTLDEMRDELLWRREEYGISYWSFESDSWEALAPVVAALAGT
jgi:probable F420-dependent oxidoreductase